MATSTAQILTNRTNSLLSTGPRTEAGKKRSSLNALRHGLMSQVVVLPTEDMNAFHSFGEGFFEDLRPSGPVEKQLVQTLINSQWRLNRFCAHETNLFALGHHENSNAVDTDDETIHTALVAATTLRANLDSIKTISIHEQRLHKLFQSTLKQFLALRADRLAREEKERHDANIIRKHFKAIGKVFDPAEFGFVLTNDQLDFKNLLPDAIQAACEFEKDKNRHASAAGSGEKTFRP